LSAYGPRYRLTVGIFTLEALQAQQGDCLLIHFGPEDEPRFVVVDGGPGTAIHDRILLPRLGQLRTRWAGEGPLPLPLVICSHIDNDHIGGVIRLVERGVPSDAVAVEGLWHNSFRRLAPAAPERELRAVLAESPLAGSVPQGDRLYEAAHRAAIAVNHGFPGDLVLAPGGGTAVHDVAELTLTVLGPDQRALDALRRKWEATRGLGPIGDAIAGNDDDSIENLSSIVFLAEYGDRTMLLTGDARGDYILDGLRRAGRLRRRGIDLDVLKVQHHGSSHSNNAEFFRQVRARHYVISANGKYDNPDRTTLQAIVDARGPTGYTIWLTNRGRRGTPLRRMLDRFVHDHPDVDVVYRCEREPSLKVDLGTSVTY
jgi:hypothetical protein